MPLIIIPAHNEEKSIATVIDAIHKRYQYPVLVVNDMSHDATAFVASNAGAKVLNLRAQLGAWGATQTGVVYALKKGYKIVITLDADGQHEPDYISELLDQLDLGNDIVIGAFVERCSKARNLARFYFKLLTGLQIEDMTSGFRAYNFLAMHVVASKQATLLDYQDIGVLLMCRRAGLQISEVQTPMNLRSSGHSRVFYSWWVVLRYMLQTSILCLSQIGTTKTTKLRYR
ncbi:MAG TPA: glycosyltransferase family 2 protein [Crenotrichaceae bacterium]|nr:glycosyltransferase family 2 protein [Crenotrichaceae bacterium]